MRVFRAELDVDAAELAALEATLDDGERERGAALRDPLARRRFLADHGLRRRLLGALSARSPATLAFTAGAHGKPALSRPPSARDAASAPLQFSAARSEELALYVVSAVAQVGIDLERIDRAAGEPPRFAERILAATERAALDGLEPVERAAALATCFARKEAWSKAVGTGIVFPLSQRALWAGDERAVTHEGVTVMSLHVGAGRAAALAIAQTPTEADWRPIVESLR